MDDNHPFLLNVSDPRLFGNDAAEDERPSVLRSYFVALPEFEEFFDAKRAFSFVKARKGVGKSALLRHTRDTLASSHNPPIVILATSSELATTAPPEIASSDYLLHFWKAVLAARINAELGTRRRFAVSDLEISVLEAAQQEGLRNRSLLSQLTDRIENIGPVKLKRPQAIGPAQLLSRFARRHPDLSIWLLVDDIDATFGGTALELQNIAAFFSACRTLASTISSLRVRTSIRPDVWIRLRFHDASLDKCEQYGFSLAWSQAGMRRILAQRVRTYLKIRHLERKWGPSSEDRLNEADEDLASFDSIPEKDVLELAFPKSQGWSTTQSGFPLLNDLAGSRPRWLMQLCRVAARPAVTSEDTSSLRVGSLKNHLAEYGRARVTDLVGESTHRCPQLQALVGQFAFGEFAFDDAELITHLATNVLPQVSPLGIDGESPVQDPRRVLGFLFEIGFFELRTPAENGFQFLTYDDAPYASGHAAGASQTWEIAGPLQRGLFLRNVRGRFR